MDKKSKTGESSDSSTSKDDNVGASASGGGGGALVPSKIPGSQIRLPVASGSGGSKRKSSLKHLEHRDKLCKCDSSSDEDESPPEDFIHLKDFKVPKRTWVDAFYDKDPLTSANLIFNGMISKSKRKRLEKPDKRGNMLSAIGWILAQDTQIDDPYGYQESYESAPIPEELVKEIDLKVISKIQSEDH